MKDHKGFTLLELVIVVIIMGIVAALAIPNFQGYAINKGLRSAARDLESDIASLKARAMSEAGRIQSITLAFDLANNNYILRIQYRDGTEENQTKTPTAFGMDIRITEANYASHAITFTARGTTTGGTTNLVNSRGSTVEITTNLTGRTHVHFNMQ
jgi:prepilin-type N-terminal cleavage/methylation domain-containing protein